MRPLVAWLATLLADAPTDVRPTVGAILGSAITLAGTLATVGVALIGVMLAQWNENRRLTKRLTYEAGEAKRARDLELRRTIFLAAADDAMQRYFRVLAIAAPDIKPNHPDLPSSSYGGLVKVHLVGSLETIQAFDRIPDFLGDLNIELTEMRARYSGNEIFMKSTVVPPQQRQELIQENSALQVRMIDRAMASGAEFGNLLARANLAARNDLAQDPLEQEAYIAHITTSEGRMLEQWRELKERAFAQSSESEDVYGQPS